MKKYFLIIDDMFVKTIVSNNIFEAYKKIINEENYKGKIQIIENYHFVTWRQIHEIKIS